MRSSSSELLLDQQEELRKRKLKELTLSKKSSNNRHQPNQSCRQRARFYMTTVLAVFSLSAGSSLLFLVPLYVDPAISTLAANFVADPVTCVTSRREDLTGLFNCSWSSCREGCTSDMYHCTHIYVRYNASPVFSTSASPPTPLDPVDLVDLTDIDGPAIGLAYGAEDDGGLAASAAVPSDEVTGHRSSPRSDEAVLLVNIKGCGYPPDVLCNNFTSMYGVEGTEFPCYHSRENRTVVLTHYNKDEQVAIIIHYFAIPFVITLATSAALCVMHCDCRCHVAARNKRDSRRPRMQELSDGSISTGVDLLASHHSGLPYPQGTSVADLVAIRPM